MLSPNLLEALREHYRSLRRKPAVWLFPGNRWHTADHPISPKVIWQACRFDGWRTIRSEPLMQICQCVSYRLCMNRAEVIGDFADLKKISEILKELSK